MKISPIFYVVLIITLSITGVSSILVLQAINVDAAERSSSGTIILSFLAPTILSILAMMVKDIHKDINSRMTELLEKAEIAAHAAGVIEGKIEGKEESKAEDKKPEVVKHSHVHHVKKREDDK